MMAGRSKNIHRVVPYKIPEKSHKKLYITSTYDLYPMLVKGILRQILQNGTLEKGCCVITFLVKPIHPLLLPAANPKR